MTGIAIGYDPGGNRKDHEIAAVPHGFRSSFRDSASEEFA